MLGKVANRAQNLPELAEAEKRSFAFAPTVHVRDAGFAVKALNRLLQNAFLLNAQAVALGKDVRNLELGVLWLLPAWNP